MSPPEKRSSIPSQENNIDFIRAKMNQSGRTSQDPNIDFIRARMNQSGRKAIDSFRHRPNKVKQMLMTKGGGVGKGRLIGNYDDINDKDSDENRICSPVSSGGIEKIKKFCKDVK